MMSYHEMYVDRALNFLIWLDEAIKENKFYKGFVFHEAFFEVLTKLYDSEADAILVMFDEIMKGYYADERSQQLVYIFS